MAERQEAEMNLYEYAERLGLTPGKLTPRDVADLYEAFTTDYDEFDRIRRQLPDIQVALADHRRKDYYPKAVVLPLLEQHYDVRAIAAVTLENHSWDSMRLILAGNEVAWAYRVWTELDDWAAFQRFLERHDWKPTYKQVKDFSRRPEGSLVGRGLVKLVARFGGTATNHLGEPVTYENGTANYHYRKG